MDLQLENFKKPCYADILEHEKAVITETYLAFEKELAEIANVINLFFEMLYLKRIGLNDESTPGYSFFFHAYEVYCQLPCDVRSLVVDFERGYYVEAFRKSRSLIETLMKLKYFLKDKESMSVYLNSLKDKKGGKITVKKFFDKIIPQAYDKYYRFVSRFTHNNYVLSPQRLASSLNSGSNKVPYRPLPTYCKPLACSAIRFLFTALLGYLNAAPYFLSQELTDNSLPIFSRCQILKKYLENKIGIKDFSQENKDDLSEIFKEISAEPSH
ncbi:MAG: hypothetical protein CK425_11295 [Parachlamydia sp.]|nr:MAG: hypothetical protein CK425_11295 [Parachlamydia sp.]